MEEITTEQRLERIRKLMEPQEPSAIHFHLSDSCSRRMGIVAVWTQGRVPHVKDPSGPAFQSNLKPRQYFSFLVTCWLSPSISSFQWRIGWISQAFIWLLASIVLCSHGLSAKMLWAEMCSGSWKEAFNTSKEAWHLPVRPCTAMWTTVCSLILFFHCVLL